MKKREFLIVVLWVVVAIGVIMSLTSIPLGTYLSFTSENYRYTAKKSVELEMTVWDDDAVVISEIVGRFMEEYPDIQVKLQVIPINQYAETVRAALDADEKIDVFNCRDGVALMECIENGNAMELDRLISEQQFDSSIYGTLFSKLRYDNHVYMLPYRLSTYVIAYNKTLFDEYGVDYPNDNMTWDELYELAKRMTITGENGHIKIHGFNLYNRECDNFALAFQNGYTYFDDNLSLFQESMEFRLRLLDEGISLSSEAYDEMYQNHIRVVSGEFMGGRAAMYLTADWTVNQMNSFIKNGKMSYEYDVIPLPRIPGREKSSFAQAFYGCVNQDTEHPQEAFLLLSYVAGANGAKVFAREGILPAAVMDEDIQKLFVNSSKTPANLQAFVNQNINLYECIYEGYDNVAQLFQEVAGKVMSHQITTEQGIRELEKGKREIGRRLYEKL